MSDLIRKPQGPEEGEEITVIIVRPDGEEYVSTGTFHSAEWNTDPIPIDDPSEPYTKWVPGETTLTLRLRKVGVRRVSSEVAQGRRILEP